MHSLPTLRTFAAGEEIGLVLVRQDQFPNVISDVDVRFEGAQVERLLVLSELFGAVENLDGDDFSPSP